MNNGLNSWWKVNTRPPPLHPDPLLSWLSLFNENVYILTDFNYATLTFLCVFQKTADCELPLLWRCWVGFISKHFCFNCTTKPGDFNASYTFRSLKDFLSVEEIFKPSNRRVHTDKHQANKRCIADLPNNMRAIPRWLIRHMTQIWYFSCFLF